jgi:two-component system, NarL family, sensor kinase
LSAPEHDRARSVDSLIAAEQEERRRLALALHDGPVQSLSGIALMLDAAVAAVGEGQLEHAQEVLEGALARQRETIRSLRDLSFALEPVILRDQGFAPAVHALAERLSEPGGTQIQVDVRDDEALSEKAQVVLYQIVREALHASLARGSASQISVSVKPVEDGVETLISDDGAGERRRRSFEPIAERVRTLNGVITIDSGDDGGTTVRVVLPPYTALGSGGDG